MRIQPLPIFQTLIAHCGVVLAGVLALFLSVPGQLRAEIIIVPHQAGYTLDINRTNLDSQVSDANGALVYTWGETCDGWTVEQRFLLNIVQRNGNAVQLIAVSSTWEAKDGSRLRFNFKRERNGETVEKIRGEAHLNAADESGYAEFELPKPARIKLPKATVFPTMHTLRLMRRATNGVKTDRQFVFDGSELEEASPVSAFILPPRMPKKPNPILKPPLGPYETRSINLAFFAPTGSAPEPEFEMSIALQDNGIAPSLLLDYGDYAVQGTLVRLKELEKPDC